MVIGIGAGLVCSACSDDVPDPDPQAVAHCQTFSEKLCTRVIDCAIDAGELPVAHRDASTADCVEQSNDGLHCARATGTGDSYGKCIADVPKLDCADVLNSADLPSECDGIIKL